MVTLEGQRRNERFGEGNRKNPFLPKGNAAAEPWLLAELFRLSCWDGVGGGQRGAGQSDFFITCPCFFTKDYLNFLLVYNFCRKRSILNPVT